MVYRQLNQINIVDAMVAIFLFAITPLIFMAVCADAKREYYPPEECGLYLAPSSIPGAGYGMYSGSEEYEIGSIVSDSDIMVPTWDLNYHNGDEKYYHLWDEYTWSICKSNLRRMGMKNGSDAIHGSCELTM